VRHEDIAGLQDLYFFDLPVGSVGLTVDHRRSPMGRNTVRLNLISTNPGMGPVPPSPRPSDVGIAGFDGLWEDDPFPEVQAIAASAYGVTDSAVARLVDAMLQLEDGPSREVG
jgi:hypothetical protein